MDDITLSNLEQKIEDLEYKLAMCTTINDYLQKELEVNSQIRQRTISSIYSTREERNERRNFLNKQNIVAMFCPDDEFKEKI